MKIQQIYFRLLKILTFLLKYLQEQRIKKNLLKNKFYKRKIYMKVKNLIKKTIKKYKNLKYFKKPLKSSIRGESLKKIYINKFKKIELSKRVNKFKKIELSKKNKIKNKMKQSEIIKQNKRNKRKKIGKNHIKQK